MYTMKRILVFLFCFFTPVFLRAADWPHWLGPTGKNVWQEQGVITSIPSDGLKTKWDFEVGLGYGGPSVAKGKVYLMDYMREQGELSNNAGSRDRLTGKERVLCLDAKTGKLLWKFEYDRSYSLSYPGGPRATPTVKEGKVYALGAEGNFNVLDAETGKLIWSKDFNKDYGAETPIWGFAAHPLVSGDTVYCIVGGEGSVVVAFDKDTGKEKWRALSADKQGYCPPTMITFQKSKQLIIWHPQAINGLNPETGEVYWSEELKPSWGGSIQAPRKLGNQLYAAGPGVAALFTLSNENGKPGVEMIWRGNRRNAFYSVNGNIIFDKEAIYGVNSETSSLTAIRIEDGSRIWETQEPVLKEVGKRERHGTAFLVRHEESNTYFILNENGDLILAEITPAGYNELGREHILEPTNRTGSRMVVWSHPAFAQKTVFVRNDKKLIAVDLNKRSYVN